MPLKLRSESLELTFVDATGALSGFLDRAASWQAIRQAPRSHPLHLCGGRVQAPLGDGFPTELGCWGPRCPTCPFLACATGFEDLGLMAQWRRHGYTPIHEPFQFNGSPANLPPSLP